MPANILLIDNYDSFTYNLVQAFLILGAEVAVHRNDAIGVEQAPRFTHSVTTMTASASVRRNEDFLRNRGM